MQRHCSNIRHLKVCSEPGKYAGWPANSGIWIWDNEILCGFSLAEHQETERGHTYDPGTARQKFARSMDGGETWSIEDAFEHGITAEAKDHALGENAVEPFECPGNVDFTHPDFAMTFRRMNDSDGTSHFYITNDRGRYWQGPYAFPNSGNPGILARSDYMVEGPHRLLAMLTASKSNNREGRVGCFRTRDGGRNWNFVSWIGPEPEGYAIMPATVKLSDSQLICIIRRREGDHCRLDAWISNDNAASWRHIGKPVEDTGHGGSPPAMVMLPEGRLCMAYAVRGKSPEYPSRICVRFSDDGGETWHEENVVRGDDGANYDVGYPRMVHRPDGRLVLLYYYNHAFAEKPSFRYIAATLFDPA